MGDPGNTSVTKRLRYVASFAAIALLTMFAAVPAFAVHDTGAFELEGNAISEATPGDDWENVCHEVTITRPYYLGVHPVTQGQWRAVMGTTPSYFSRRRGGKERVKDVSAAEKTVCSPARDKHALIKRVDDIKKYESNLKDPTYTWTTPTVEKQEKASTIRMAAWTSGVRRKKRYWRKRYRN